jgi:multifunctional beta-oxidation protein
MAIYDAKGLLPDGQPGPWGEPVAFTYAQRDVLLYAVGIGARALRFVYEGDPGYAVFPTFPIRWGGAGTPVDRAKLPPSPGPLTIDAERYLERLAPLPLAGTLTVRSRLLAVHPRGKGAGFVETESIVSDEQGKACVRMVNGSFRRGVAGIGDIEPFEGRGETFSARVDVPARAPDLEASATIADNQAHLYRLSGDYNPLHIDPAAARFGGFEAPILHGLCTYGHCAHLLLGAACGDDPARFRRLKLRFASPVYPGDVLRVLGWREAPGRIVFEARVGERVVVSNAYFEHG